MHKVIQVRLKTLIEIVGGNSPKHPLKTLLLKKLSTLTKSDKKMDLHV